MLEDYILRHKSSALMYMITRYLKFYLMVITVDHSTFPIIYRIAKKEETNSNLAFGDHYQMNERCIKNTKKHVHVYFIIILL